MLNFTPCQLIAYGKLMNTKDNFFITGFPGVGKTTLIKTWLDSTLERVAVVASTGSAACLVGGQTFHSFFALGILTESLENILKEIKYEF
jgi:Cdc6-like AAA superfamily ATPase